MAPPAKMALLALLCCLPCLAAHADAPAVLKLQVQLDAGTIKVSDLWANAGTKSDTVIGPAPPPGRTIAIEAAQLAYIARLYDVDWRPISGVERTSLERLGRPLARDEVAEPIRRNLVESGVSPSVTVELSNFSPILVPPLSFPIISVEGISYDPADQRFSANIVASADGMATERMRVAGRVMDTVTAVVATRRLQPNDIIAPADVRLAQVAARSLPGPVATDLSQVVGQTPKRAIVAGQPMAAADVGPPALVAKGATVVLVLETPSMSLAAQGVALSAGGRDEMIQVMNPLSRAVVAARVAGPGRAVITPGAAPIVPPLAAPPRNPEVAN